MNDIFLNHVAEYFKNKYECHSIILYGSYVTGDFTEESDLDVICFTDGRGSQNDNHSLDGIQLDAWIYNTSEMNNPSKFSHTRNGILLLDQRGLGELLLQKMDEIYIKGPEKLDSHEIAFLKNWLTKMQKRSLKEDIEGNFRYHLLLNDSLEIYFKIINQWYLGPKNSLQWLEINDPKAYELFSRALARNADYKSVDRLIQHIIEI
jgi:hypothetical protein